MKLFWNFVLVAGLTWSAVASDFPALYNSEIDSNAVPPAASDALAMLKLPPGFKATVFAAEPDVQNPIAMTWDGRGRLWVAENYTYAERALRFDLHLRDRVLIFEDAKGNGHFSSRKVFTDNVQMLTSVEVGLGGVWVMCPPQLLFIPDRNHDDVPDGPAEVVLDGFTVPAENYHNFANGLRWGPDGWLYGRCGASAPGDIGRPGTAAAERVPMRGGIWRYHPQRKVVEALTAGTTNPWGHDWDENGELFYINTVNGHLWHGIAGAHFVRPHTYDPNPRAYEMIDLHADHWHFDTASDWTRSRNGAANSFGGGHAHSGMMIYQGDNWPAEYRGKLMTLNLHGRRTNIDRLDREGSGYIGRHEPDILLAGDPWFRGIDLGSGPDGGVFVLDWSDTGECHESTGVHRLSGRIYKVTHGDPPAVKIDFSKLSVAELVERHRHSNEWMARLARRELVERVADGRGVKGAERGLREIFENDAEVVHKLRSLWTLADIGLADDNFLRAQLVHANEHVRAWAIRLLTDTWPIDTVMSARPARPEATGWRRLSAPLVRLAETDPSGLVRLTLASTLQRLPYEARPALAAPLVRHAEDTLDHNLPLMIWYGLIPVEASALERLAENCELAATRRLMARRLGEDVEKNPGPLNRLLEVTTSRSVEFQSDVLAGLSESLKGWRKAPKPKAWDALSGKLAAGASAKLREWARDLSVVFGDGRALNEVKRVALDGQRDLSQRISALETLIASRPPELRRICEDLLAVRGLNSVAVRGLSQFADADLGRKLAANYRNFSPADRRAVMDTLVAQPVFTPALLDQMGQGKIPRSELTPFHARQVLSFHDAALAKKLEESWGRWREASGDKKEQIAQWKKKLTPQALARADARAGRVAFNTACASCHTLYGTGGSVGPDLTGGGRDNLDYLLENVVDPSAVVSADFRMTVATLKDGRVLNGMVMSRGAGNLKLKTMTEIINVNRGELASLEESELSMMPEGLLEALGEATARNLIAYLMQKTQVPLPGE